VLADVELCSSGEKAVLFGPLREERVVKFRRSPAGRSGSKIPIRAAAWPAASSAASAIAKLASEQMRGPRAPDALRGCASKVSCRILHGDIDDPADDVGLYKLPLLARCFAQNRDHLLFGKPALAHVLLRDGRSGIFSRFNWSEISGQVNTTRLSFGLFFTCWCPRGSETSNEGIWPQTKRGLFSSTNSWAFWG
jgi:hypothetical protein